MVQNLITIYLLQRENPLPFFSKQIMWVEFSKNNVSGLGMQEWEERLNNDYFLQCVVEAKLLKKRRMSHCCRVCGFQSPQCSYDSLHRCLSWLWTWTQAETWAKISSHGWDIKPWPVSKSCDLTEISQPSIFMFPFHSSVLLLSSLPVS